LYFYRDNVTSEKETFLDYKHIELKSSFSGIVLKQNMNLVITFIITIVVLYYENIWSYFF